MIEPMLNVTQCGFRPGRSTTDVISLSSKFLRNVESTPKTSTYALSTSRKHNTGFLVKSLLREYDIEGHLLLAVKSLHSCSEICVHVGKVKSRPFTVGVGLRQGCVLSPLHFIVSTQWRNRRVVRGARLPPGKPNVKNGPLLEISRTTEC